MFTDCAYDETGQVVCTYRGLPFQCTENETPEEWFALQAAIKSREVLVGPYVSTPVALPLPAEAAMVERTWRNVELAATDGVVTRHRDELEENIATTLTMEQYGELQAYRRQLRDWPQGGGFPLSDHRPVAPLWLSEQEQ